MDWLTKALVLQVLLAITQLGRVTFWAFCGSSRVTCAWTEFADLTWKQFHKRVLNVYWSMSVFVHPEVTLLR